MPKQNMFALYMASYKGINGHEIRFIEVSGEWWAILKDITNALSLRPKHIKERLSDEVVSTDHILNASSYLYASIEKSVLPLKRFVSGLRAIVIIKCL